MPARDRLREALESKSFSPPVVSGKGLATSRVIYVLETGEPGEIIDDEELEKVVGRPVSPGHSGYQILYKAVLYLERNRTVFWGRIRGEGKIVCLTHEERLRAVVAARQKIHRASKRAAHNSATVNRAELAEEEDRRLLDVSRVQMAVLECSSSSTNTKRLLQAGHGSIGLPSSTTVVDAIVNMRLEETKEQNER